ncbi:helix-turn-helix domain-containing protein [Gordonia sp. TBRC 11910]|uniref:Helix-turn-helix domain-containing protein n=1 Tax=Gordonia asplenii TaxID=2725283 RepID=A0A848KUT0_9ACTN|nr:IclR family transcriptional regulator C-terminal domain-containing protein [Gordonia asplenii]NMO02436.1 helix-turn-helix domain-containing protein [Gordonia asplenii]
MSAIQLLSKAGQVVDELARSGPSTPAELAKAVNEPRPTVYRIGQTLEELELVRNVGGRLELGVGLLRWADAAIEAFIDRAELHKQLCWVREQVGMNVYFCVPGVDGPLCLHQVAGAVVEMVDLGPGRTLPRSVGAVGRAFDAGSDESYFLDDGDVVDGIAAVAVPVRCDGDVVGVVAVADLRAGLLPRADAVATVLTTAAAALAAAMSQPREGRETTPDVVETDSRTTSLIHKGGVLMEVLVSERIATSGRLTELTGEPPSSVYRMLATLTEIGWVEQVFARGPYRVGGKVLTLAAELIRSSDIRRAAGPVLAAIHAATGETTFLCVRHGTRAVCIERIDGVRVNSRVLRLGRSLPLHVGAAPRALLAFDDREAWDEYASAAVRSDELGGDVGSRAELFAQLEEIRQAGIVVSDNTVTPGIAAIGAPIFDHYGRVVASLSVSGLRDGILARSRDGGPSVRDLVRRGARDLTHYLGGDVG